MFYYILHVHIYSVSLLYISLSLYLIYTPSRLGYSLLTAKTTHDGTPHRFPFPSRPYFHKVNCR